jgi:RNA polymerase sigma-70 factor, ECF subfamily
VGTEDAAIRTAAGRPDDSIDRWSDASLVNRMIEGSEDALAILYDRHVKGVHSAALRMGRDPSIAAEVVEETFLALWNRAEQFDPTRGTLPGWLQTIARNRAVDHLRATARHGRAVSFSSLGPAGGDPHAVGDWLTATGELIGTAKAEPSPEAALARRESITSIEEAFAALAPVEQTVIALAYQAELSQVEIAERLGWPLGTVKTRTRRALRHLREQLEQPAEAVQQRDASASVTVSPERSVRAGSRVLEPCMH